MYLSFYACMRVYVSVSVRRNASPYRHLEVTGVYSSRRPFVYGGLILTPTGDRNGSHEQNDIDMFIDSDYW